MTQPDAEISREFLVSENGRLTPYAVSVSAATTEGGEHSCWVSLSPFLKSKKRGFGTDQQQAATIAREFVAALLAGKDLYLTEGGPDVTVEQLLG